MAGARVELMVIQSRHRAVPAAATVAFLFLAGATALAGCPILSGMNAGEASACCPRSGNSLPEKCPLAPSLQTFPYIFSNNDLATVVDRYQPRQPIEGGRESAVVFRASPADRSAQIRLPQIDGRKIYLRNRIFLI